MLTIWNRYAATAFAASLLGLLAPLVAPANGQSLNLLPNGSVEDGDLSSDAPANWTREVYSSGVTLTWDWSVAHEGTRSLRITSAAMADAAWVQSITLDRDRNYLLSGWIKTENVEHTPLPNDAGANLCVMGTLHRTAPLHGTNDWTYVRMAFNSGPTGIVRIGARLGYSLGFTRGTAWFDDLRITEINPTDPHPSWKVLVLIYETTDLTYTDGLGSHHLVGQISATQTAAAVAAASRFVETDIPALTSGHMIPELTIRFPGTLVPSRLGDAWAPSPAATADARDPAFDSVIVIWQPTVTDQATGEVRWIGNAAGLAWQMGAAQTYAALILEAATTYGHLNVFKHEWGHSILFYFEAAGTAPLPTVQNHTEPFTYVNCSTGLDYVWVDESDTHPIPNSIYSNQSGFTHDYYSGQTALATNPTQCLGITASAWAGGGPVSKPGGLPPPTAVETIESARASLVRLVQTGALRRSWSHALESSLDRAARALAEGYPAEAIKALELFSRHAASLVEKGRLGQADAAAMLALTDGVIRFLRGG